MTDILTIWDYYIFLIFRSSTIFKGRQKA